MWVGSKVHLVFHKNASGSCFVPVYAFLMDKPGRKCNAVKNINA